MLNIMCKLKMTKKIVQKELFLEHEADSWFDRNKEGLLYFSENPTKDPIIKLLNTTNLKPKNILEIGCSDGWRLQYLKEHFSNSCSGIDPSQKSINAGKDKFSGLDLRVGTADDLPYETNEFDMVVFGFCLYLCDPVDLFVIAKEADRVLNDGGHIITYDFCPPFPYKNPYSHSANVNSYKMDYSRMFLWNPSYVSVYSLIVSHSNSGDLSIVDDRVGVNILLKSLENAYPKVSF